VAKEQTQLADALAQAVAALIEDGSYEQVLSEWGVEAGAIDEPTVNPTVG
jgi:polar amino acid transport system substrate-binding protein